MRYDSIEDMSSFLDGVRTAIVITDTRNVGVLCDDEEDLVALLAEALRSSIPLANLLADALKLIEKEGD